jgi:hypothetical protein
VSEQARQLVGTLETCLAEPEAARRDCRSGQRYSSKNRTSRSSSELGGSRSSSTRRSSGALMSCVSFPMAKVACGSCGRSPRDPRELARAKVGDGVQQ